MVEEYRCLRKAVSISRSAAAAMDSPVYIGSIDAKIKAA
jgi:hypothetical protein